MNLRNATPSEPGRIPVSAEPRAVHYPDSGSRPLPSEPSLCAARWGAPCARWRACWRLCRGVNAGPALELSEALEVLVSRARREGAPYSPPQTCCSSIRRDHSGRPRSRVGVPLSGPPHVARQAILASLPRERLLSPAPADELRDRASSSIVAKRTCSPSWKRSRPTAMPPVPGRARQTLERSAWTPLSEGPVKRRSAFRRHCRGFDLGCSSGYFRTCAPRWHR